MELQTPRKGKRFDIRFDDLTIRWRESPLAAERAEMAEKTGGLLLRYTFDDDSQIAQDSSGQKCHGEIHGDPQLVQGVTGHALALDGEDDWIRVPLSRRLRFLRNSNFTVVAWFNPTSLPEEESGDGFGIVIKPGADVGLIRDNGGTFRFTRYFHAMQTKGERGTGDDNTKAVWLGFERSPLHEWYHLAGVARDGGKSSQLYINGELIVEEEHPDFHRAIRNMAPWHVGTCDGRSKRWMAHGIIDDVRLYGRALAGQEIAALYAEQE